MPVDLDRAGPVNDNRTDLQQRASQGGSKKNKKDGYVVPAGKDVPAGKCHVPQATSLPGSMGIIENAGARHGDRKQGIPGILTTTSLGADTRTRLISGIIDLSQHKPAEDGPVHMVTGHDATAMNAGMRPIPGARIHGGSGRR